MLSLLALNYTLTMVVTPQYAQFGSQIYCNHTVNEVRNCTDYPQLIIPCDVTAPADICTPTVISTFIHRITVNTPFFGVIFYHAHWVFLGVTLLGFIYAMIKSPSDRLYDDLDDEMDEEEEGFLMANSPKLQEFLSWAQERGVISDIQVQDIPDKGLGFVTKRNVTRDNSIVAYIPYSILLNATKISRYAKDKAPKLEETFNALMAEGKHLSERDIFILFLLYERLAPGGETSSLWKAYIDILPRTLHTPLFYDPTLRACLDGTSLKPAVDAKYNKLKKEYESLRSLFNKWSKVEDAGGHDVVTFEHFRWADGVFWSRVLSFGSRFQTIDSIEGDLDDFHLVPFLDFANHSLTPYARWEIGTEGVELILTKSDSLEPITSDTEICISYGDKPNSELLFVHGFTLSDNPWSAISFPVPFYDDDELAKAKLLFMQYHGIKHLVSLARKKGGAELSHDSTRAMWICVLAEEDGIKFKLNHNDPSHPIDLFIGNQIIPTLDVFDNVINSMELLPVIEFRVMESVLENVEYLLSHLKQTNEQVLKMMEHGRNSRELEYVRIYREDEYKFLEFAVEDFTRKRDALMTDEVVQRFMLNDQ
ncbi:11137_t:CDS:2 [Funneliformis mosseae]|uniref:11137_t:CDS:1 n=1 Tax=Funneliformis mosseae TaxID=27381 RepID=A0A9N9CUD1_FUNMO|nr:11137_t:CDS:2 [Funneliformis mosseae]